MTRADVEKIIGHPLVERKGDNGDGVILDYAREGLALHSFSFWVYFDSQGRVNTVRVTQCPLFTANYAIYDARPNLPVYEDRDFARIVDTER